MNEKLIINITAEGTAGRIDIIGSIAEWTKNNAVDFRERCQAIKDAGANNILVYQMTVGGDCFQANEIVNILIEIFGSYKCEGGAIVASAGTYISVCGGDTFEIAKNGQYMIHKPMGGTYGNEQMLGNYLTLLQNMTKTYYEAYVAKLQKPEAEFKAKWDNGDFWMTAKEAVEWGFATSVKEPVKIDKAAAQAIAACGSPLETIIDKYENEMDNKLVARAIGLPDTATDEQINAKLAENARKAAEFDTLKAQTEQREKEQKSANIKAWLDAAEKDKRIKATDRKKWEEKLEADLGVKALLDSLQPVTKLSAEIVTSSDGVGATYQGKTFEQMQEDPEALAQLESENIEAYNALFADWKKRNKIK